MGWFRRLKEAGKRGPKVRAAGGVVWKGDGTDDVKVAVIHRPRYDDWTLPKGKLLPDEEELAAALREVEEETGFQCAVGDEIGVSRYTDRKGREKEVRYWTMQPTGGRFRPSQEVDELRWVSPSEAVELLTYDRDRDVLEGFAPTS
jgi:8-oxo-dGTP pyrophosphatase MutT (NUDIX family)